MCPDKVKPGAFNQENIILFLLSKEGKNSTEKAIFSNNNEKRHENVDALQTVPNKVEKGFYISSRYDRRRHVQRRSGKFVN